MRKLVMSSAVALMAVGALGLTGHAPAPLGSETASASAAPCAVTWGSLPKQAGTFTPALVTNARAGRHECYDRLVIDLGAGPVAGYRVQYVPQVVQDGSGDPVPLAGGAALSIYVQAWDWDFETSQPSYDPPDRLHAVDVTGFSTFRQVAHVGSFEGETQFGLGVRARLPFRVLTLTGPGAGSRLVIDVAHRW
jgi:hypothetical protein